MAKKKKQIVKVGKWSFDLGKYKELLGRGLSCGPRQEHQVCIEAAVSIALGESDDPKVEDPNNDNTFSPKDDPSCVHPELSDLKININDDNHWKSSASRAKGLKAVGIAQLGTAGKWFKWKKFVEILDDLLAQRLWPELIKGPYSSPFAEFYRSGKFRNPTPLEEIFMEDFHDSLVYLPKGLHEILDEVTDEKHLVIFADCIVEALKKMKAPGVKLLKRL